MYVVTRKDYVLIIKIHLVQFTVVITLFEKKIKIIKNRKIECCYFIQFLKTLAPKFLLMESNQ